MHLVRGERSPRAALWIIPVVLALAAPTFLVLREPAPAPSPAPSIAPTPTPIGQKKYMVFMGDGMFDMAEAMATTNESFQRDVMRRSPAEVAQKKADALTFFRQRFGLDFSGGDAIPAATLMSFEIPWRVNYRAYTISGEAIPATGWEVRDGGWTALVNPGGTTLHGDWGGSAGRWVPAGSAIAFGDYSIKVETLDGPDRPPIVMSYKAVEPVLQALDGATTPLVNCEFISPEFGQGQGYGVSAIRMRADGKVHQIVRTVLTF